MMLVSTISYVDRNTLALLIPTIRAETGLSAEQYGWIVSAFSVAYMLGNPAWGALLDRIGVRTGMTAAVGWWSLASAAHAWASSFGAFAALRFALGFGEGATFPGALRTVQQTLPPDRRGRGIALSYSGGSLGAILTPVLMTPVAIWLGWRGAFLFTGLLGVAWLAWWLWLSRDAALRGRPRETQAGRIDFRDIRLWGTLASYSMGAVPLGFVLYNASIYLTAKFGVSQTGLGALLWIPPAGWEAGYFFWGWMCDRFGVASVGKLMRAAMVLSLPLAFAPRADSLPLLMAQLFFAMFMTSGFIIPSINYATHIVPKGATSLVAGLGAGSFSLLTAGLAPVFGRFFDQGRYEAAFALAALFPALGYAAFRAANRSIA
jgi:ACS family hexuronate transporter-like MFS transporter